MVAARVNSQCREPELSMAIVDSSPMSKADCILCGNARPCTRRLIHRLRSDAMSNLVKSVRWVRLREHISTRRPSPRLNERLIQSDLITLITLITLLTRFTGLFGTSSALRTASSERFAGSTYASTYRRNKHRASRGCVRCRVENTPHAMQI